LNFSTEDMVIVGGGPAGIFAALGAQQQLRALGKSAKLNIALLEQNSRLGKKILISGGGKCNISHEGSVKDLLEKGFLTPSHARFLKPALHEFTNTDLLELLIKYGVKTSARPDGCVFPASGLSQDVLRAFEKALAETKTKIYYGALVTTLKKTELGFEVRTPTHQFNTRCLILATGGVSYPKTGSTGDGLRFAEHLGHRIVKPTSALSPIFLSPVPHKNLVGVSCRQVGLIASQGDKKASRIGDLLFSHKGITGPAALSLSTVVGIMNPYASEIKMQVDFFPSLKSEELEQQILNRAKQSPNLQINNLLKQLAYQNLTDTQKEPPFPQALFPILMEQAGLSTNTPLSQLTKTERKAFIKTLKAFDLGKVKSLPLEQGEISSGGVPLKEVNPKTMQSRLVESLFLCGELLDYAGEIGGYNLQAAYSSGWLAGVNAVKSF